MEEWCIEKNGFRRLPTSINSSSSSSSISSTCSSRALARRSNEHSSAQGLEPLGLKTNRESQRPLFLAFSNAQSPHRSKQTRQSTMNQVTALRVFSRMQPRSQLRVISRGHSNCQQLPPPASSPPPP
jgi:uncharacterized ParB-like nuclease family protein